MAFVSATFKSSKVAAERQWTVPIAAAAANICVNVVIFSLFDSSAPPLGRDPSNGSLLNLEAQSKGSPGFCQPPFLNQFRAIACSPGMFLKPGGLGTGRIFNGIRHDRGRQAAPSFSHSLPSEKESTGPGAARFMCRSPRYRRDKPHAIARYNIHPGVPRCRVVRRFTSFPPSRRPGHLLPPLIDESPRFLGVPYRLPGPHAPAKGPPGYSRTPSILSRPSLR